MMVEDFYSLIQSKSYAEFYNNKIFHIYSGCYLMSERLTAKNDEDELITDLLKIMQNHT